MQFTYSAISRFSVSKLSGNENADTILYPETKLPQRLKWRLTIKSVCAKMILWQISDLTNKFPHYKFGFNFSRENAKVYKFNHFTIFLLVNETETEMRIQFYIRKQSSHRGWDGGLLSQAYAWIWSYVWQTSDLRNKYYNFLLNCKVHIIDSVISHLFMYSKKLESETEAWKIVDMRLRAIFLVKLFSAAPCTV